MKTLVLPLAGAVALGAVLVVLLQPGPTAMAQSSQPAEGTPMTEVILPADLPANAAIGKRAFDGVCAACHGENAAGKMGFGPPLVHRFYEPSHHGDMAFSRAVALGAQAHHWTFGDMPPQEGLTDADVTAIISYVRALQRANGID